MKIIPAIDLIDGKCVRLSQGDYAQKTIYNSDPLEVAKSFEDAGLEYLHLVDLDGAKAQHIVNWKVLEAISSGTNLHIDFGGGIKSDEDVKIAFDNGAHQITCGSIAVKKPELMARWIEELGPEKIILGADVKDKLIAISGWMEDSGIELNTFLKDYLDKGIRYATCTDIATDGMLSGPNVNLYQEVMKDFPELNLIASGGVSSIDDIHQLKAIGVYGVITGKAIYEGKISLESLSSI
ncbi:MAG: 1-(5-phosphoribosyl)-5-[(5-phosphoribosylamino)methylideneamino]imidazole-4-carboxamide isomerase [Bacteroidota bacterium]